MRAFAAERGVGKSQTSIDLFVSLPYVQYENSPLWKLLDVAIADLERNQDLQVTTAREHVLGYLCQQLSPLRHGGSIHEAILWRWLRERSWPAHLSDDDRLELARDVVRIAEAGTGDHVAIYLRDLLPTTVEPSVQEIAPQLMAILTRSRAEHGAGAF